MDIQIKFTVQNKKLNPYHTHTIFILIPLDPDPNKLSGSRSCKKVRILWDPDLDPQHCVGLQRSFYRKILV